MQQETQNGSQIHQINSISDARQKVTDRKSSARRYKLPPALHMPVSVAMHHSMIPSSESIYLGVYSCVFFVYLFSCTRIYIYIILYYIILYYIILYYIILYYIISYYIILYHIISYYIILYHIISYYIILYHIISYYIILYHIIS